MLIGDNLYRIKKFLYCNINYYKFLTFFIVIYMKKFTLLLLLFAFFISGCTITGSYGHVESFDMEVSAAHELRGASGYLEPHKSTMRLSANVHPGSNKKKRLSGIINEVGNCKDIVNCNGFNRDSIQEKVDGVYAINFPIVTGSFDFIRKMENMLWGVNVGIDNGGDGNFLFGFNSEHFEIGLALGFWVHARNFEYSGTEYDCVKYAWSSKEKLATGPFTRNSSMELHFTYGGFASAYIDPVSINYSINIYRPHPSYGEDWDGDKLNADFEYPLVVTQYITLGTRINEYIELRLGAVNIFGGFSGSYWAFNGGLSFYIK